VCAQSEKRSSELLPPPRPLHVEPAGAHLANADDVRQKLGLVPEYENVPGIEAIKIAVLDYGFDGLGGTRQYLPANTVVVEHYDPEFIRRFKLGDPDYRKSFSPQNNHGRTLAQIVWAVTGFNANGPRFYLLNANGPTLLRRAVRYAIEAKVDIILFSGTFEGGGNGDGRGPVNRVVAEALAADILWINAAGNFGGRVFNGPVEVLPDGFLKLGSDPDASALRFRNLLDENTIAITLTWNDYREQEDAGTDKDLDLYVEDWQGKRVAASEKTQVPAGKIAGPEETRNPRERIVLTDLPASADQDYRIRIRVKKGKFSSADQIRVLLSPRREAYFDPQTNTSTPAVRFIDASGKGEIFPPADNPLVLTVGEIGPTCARGPTADHRVKPDVILPDSRALFTNGEMTLGTSNSAAYFAGVAALLKAAEPGLRTRHLLWFAHYGKARQIALGRDGMPLPTSRSPGGERLPQINNGLMPMRRMPMPARYAGPAPALSREQQILLYRQRQNVLPQRSAVPSSNFAAATATPSRQLRVWQTPTQQELREQVQKDR
jgi:hypothetical protein